jgi:hypothetical protein
MLATMYSRLQDGLAWVQSAPARSRMHDLLKVKPRPLIAPEARMVVLFSPKAACTNVVMWFLHHLGHGQKARDYAAWPHRYRGQVYYQSDLYRDACRLDLTGFTVIKVIRDSFDRAESAFRHALATRLIKNNVAPVLGDLDVVRDGLSFDQFLTFLEHSDLTTCDPHFRLQRHPIEDVLPVHHLINISREDLHARLGEIERELGLPKPGPEFADWLHSIRNHRRPEQELPPVDDLYHLRFTQLQARKGPWPAAGSFINPHARERLKKLYAIDIDSYRQAIAPEPSTN